MNSTGSVHVVSLEYKLERAKGVGCMFWLPKASLMNIVIEDSSLSGLST